MKRLISIALLLLGCSSLLAQKITFMPHWTPQAQFIGYYVAKDKGFYEQEGLDVEIRHLNRGSKRNIISYIRSGEAQFVTSHLLPAMMARDGGLDIVNVLQTSRTSGLCVISKEPISSFEDLNGKTVGRWSTGNGENAILMAEDKNLSIDWVTSNQSVNLFLAGALDATLAFSYNELISVLLALGRIEQDHVLYFSDTEYNFPEDGIYCTGEYYRNNRSVADKFVKASRDGWTYAAEHPDEALEICMKYMREGNVQTNIVHQKLMLEKIISLSKGADDEVDFEPISRELFDTMATKARETGLIIYPLQYEEIIKQ